MTEAAATKQASVATLHVSVVWAFLQKLEPLRGTYRGPVGHGIA